MGAWKWNGKGWDTASIRRDNLGLDAYLYCPGPSLANVDNSTIHVPGAMAFAINTAYPHIRPDVWMGLDYPECYDRSLWDEPFLKLCRGGRQEMTSAGMPVKLSVNTMFLDTKKPTGDDPYQALLAKSDTFTWHKNTLIWALHIMVYMGAKKIHLVGCDMGGNADYHDGRELTPAQRRCNRRLYGLHTKAIKELSPRLKQIGVDLVSCTPDSPLNEFLPFIDLDKALMRTESRVVKSSILNSGAAEIMREKICVITPTRGDRPDFLSKLRYMLAEQTRPPDAHFIVDFDASDEKPDIRKRVLYGVRQAMAAGYRRALVMEDDDYYAPNYIESMLEVWPHDVALIGSRVSHIYHLKERVRLTYTAEQLSRQMHGMVASLSTTGFHVEAFLRFSRSRWWTACPQLDQELWRWAATYDIPRKFTEIPFASISMKHGVGKVGGGCHGSIKDRPGAIPDKDAQWLKQHTASAFHNFYAGLGG